MDTEELNKIYDELNQISVQIEPRSIPNPRYISEKIGECHVCIERVEKIYIRANKELSVYQIALNNATAAFEIARDNLIANDPDIASLPSTRDRESTANTRLKNQINEINFYKQALQSSETLVKTLTMKLKNLTRLNGDIRLQMKIMESQIRLGTGDINDPTTKNLMDELKKTVLGQDVWEGAETKSEENSIMDPSKPIDAKDLDPLAAFERTVENMISNPETTPDKINTPVIQADSSAPVIDVSQPADPIINISEPYTESIKPMDFNNPTKQEPEPITKSVPASLNLEDLLAGFNSSAQPILQPAQPINTVLKPAEVVSQETETDTGSLFLPEDDIFELEPSEEDEVDNEVKSPVDLDIVLSVPNPKIGGNQEPEKVDPVIIKESESKGTQKVEQNSNEMLFESLLSQFN